MTRATLSRLAGALAMAALMLLCIFLKVPR